MSNLTSISDRMTPSSPIEVTYGSQPAAVGRKFTTIFGHRALTGGDGIDYEPYEVVNVGDSVAAKTELEALYGAGAQIVLMAIAFIEANSKSGSSNFPAFRVVALPHAEDGFGPADEALEAVKFLRTDMFVSCYGADEATLRQKLIDLCSLLSGPDRDLNGQFGSFCTFGYLDTLANLQALDINSRHAIIAYLRDTNTAAVAGVTATTVLGSKVLSAASSTAGVYEGAQISGTGIPAGAVVTKVTKTTIQISLAATAAGTAIALTIQNVVSQPLEIVAAAHAGRQMASAFPYNPLQNVAIGGLKPPKKKSDWILFDPNGASETALRAGASPLTVQPGNVVAFIRSRTTFTTIPGNIEATFYLDWQDIVTLYDFREVCYQVSQQPPFNNNPGGTKASLQIAAKFKDEILREASAFETKGAFQFVKELSKFFKVEVSTTSRGRFDFQIPVDVVPGLYVIAGNIKGVAASELIPDLNFTV